MKLSEWDAPHQQTSDYPARAGWSNDVACTWRWRRRSLPASVRNTCNLFQNILEGRVNPEISSEYQYRDHYSYLINA